MAPERKDRLLLIDGHALVYRAFFAMPALSNSRGELTNAAFGFTSMLLKVLTETQPTCAIAAFDPHGPTFRHEADETYKAQRPSMPSDLRPQMQWSRDICTALSIPIVEQPGFEADDVIGTLATKAAAAGVEVVILTGDLDALQLVNEHVVVCAPRRGITETVIYDVEAVRERFGFDPPKMVDYKALRGDPSDNIPGVPGIGEKTASALIVAHGDVDGVLAAVEGMKPGRVRDALAQSGDQIRHSRFLATIRRDVDVELDLDAARRDGYDEAAVHELFERLEFRSLLPRLSAAGEQAVVAEPVERPVADVVVATDVVQDAGAAAAMVERLREGTPVAIRTVADGLNTVGIALSTHDGEAAYYVPLAQTLDSAAPDAVASVEALLRDDAVAKQAYDTKREILLWRHRGVVLAHCNHDLMLAAYLLNTRTRVASAALLAHDWLSLDIADDDAFLGSGRNRRWFGDVPVEEMAGHAGASVSVIGRLHDVMRARLKETDQARLLEELELPLVPILAEMELAGVRVDPHLLGVISSELGVRIAEIETAVHDVAGRAFNLGSTQQLAAVLYDELGLASGRKTKTGRSTDADTLEALREEHPIVAQILEWRQLTKLKSTYVDTLPSLCDADSRIHTSYHQAVAATGRLSSSDPNLQNIPIRSEWGQRIRAAFIADPGTQLVSADYSQIELRVLAHLSQEDDLVEAFQRGEDIHQRTAAEVYGVAPDAVTYDMRRVAKVVNFGVLYGLSDFGLARDTGMARADAAAFIERYFASFPKITAYLETIRNQARQHGWVETMMGRRRYLPDIRAANRQIRSAAERMAVNMPMQGTAADIMKLAMIRVDAALREADYDARLLLQVHDELVIECPDAHVERCCELLHDAMAHAVQLSVPLDVDVKVGGSWASMTRVKAASAVRA